MYYRNNNDIWKKLYNVTDFDSYDNYYYLIIDKKQAEKNLAVYIDKLQLHTDVHIEEHLLEIYKSNTQDFQNPVKVVWGHFYNDFDDLLYHPVKKDGTYHEKIFNFTPYDTIVFINGQMCYNKSYKKILELFDFFTQHPELYLSINTKEIKCNYIYTNNEIHYDDTVMLDANVEGDTAILNNLTR